MTWGSFLLSIFTLFLCWTIHSMRVPTHCAGPVRNHTGKPSDTLASRETAPSRGQTHVYTQTRAIEEAQLCGWYKRPWQNKGDHYPRQFSDVLENVELLTVKTCRESFRKRSCCSWILWHLFPLGVEGQTDNASLWPVRLSMPTLQPLVPLLFILLM